MKKALTGVLSIILAVCGLAGLAACGKSDPLVMNETEWGESLEAFFTESVGTKEQAKFFADHFEDFEYADGKYTAASIPAEDGFTYTDIVITVEEVKDEPETTAAVSLSHIDGIAENTALLIIRVRILNIEYKIRTDDLDTPDRLITIDQDGAAQVDIPKPSDYEKMDEDEWKASASIFGQVTNYSLVRYDVTDGEEIASMKLAGETYYESVELTERIYTTDGTKYYKYARTLSPTWTKTEVDEDTYENVVFTPSTMVAVAAKALDENFSSFTFSEGVYRAASVTVNYYYDFTLTDVEITVSGGKVVRAVCTLVGGYEGDGDERITVDHIGSTVIDIPQVTA